jgi:uncharacterized ion transporter superfamily protein YfcC
MAKIDKQIKIIGCVAIAIAVGISILMVVNVIHNGILAEDTQIIQGMKLFLICLVCYFLGLAIAEGTICQEMKQDKGDEYTET